MTKKQAITVAGLRKSFGDNLVLDGLDLEVRTGSVYALLGPNGAGKTTVVRILSTLIEADAGEMTVAGHDLIKAASSVRAAIGVTGQFSAVDDLLTGRENLRLMADLHRLPRADGEARAGQLLEQLDLIDAADKRAATYSGGMRRRLDLAMTLIARPRLIFLDEPTTGLDPRSRRAVWRIIGDLVAGGVSIFLTTQYLEEADQLADMIGVLDHGRLVAEGTPEELKRHAPGAHIRLKFADADSLGAGAAALGLPAPGEALDLRVPTNGSVADLRRVLARLDLAGVGVETLSVHTPDLDDVFLALTGRPADEQPTQDREFAR